MSENKSSNELDEDRTDLAEDRTDWAEPIKTMNMQLIAGLMGHGSAALGIAIWAMDFPDE